MPKAGCPIHNGLPEAVPSLRRQGREARQTARIAVTRQERSEHALPRSGRRGRAAVVIAGGHASCIPVPASGPSPGNRWRSPPLSTEEELLSAENSPPTFGFVPTA